MDDIVVSLLLIFGFGLMAAFLFGCLLVLDFVLFKLTGKSVLVSLDRLIP